MEAIATRRTGVDNECPHGGLEALVHNCASAQVGVGHAIERLAKGRATTTSNIEAPGIALWKGGAIRHGVDGGVNISIEYAFRNLDKAQFLEGTSGAADIWY